MALTTPVLYQISGTNPESIQTFAVELDASIQPATFQFVIYEELSEQVINHNVSVSNVVTIDQGYNNKYIVDLPIQGDLCSNNMYVVVSVITDNTTLTITTQFSAPVLIVGPPTSPTISHAFRTTDGSNNLDIYFDVSSVCSLSNFMNIAVQYVDVSDDEVHFQIYSNLPITSEPYNNIDYYYCTVVADEGSLPLLSQGHISAQQVTLFGTLSSEYSSSSKFGNTVEVDTSPLPPTNVDASYNCDISTNITWIPNAFNEQYFNTDGYKIYVYSNGINVDIVTIPDKDIHSHEYNQYNIEGISPGDQITFTVTTLATHKDDPYKHEESLESDPTQAYMYIQPADAPTDFVGEIKVNLLSIDLTWTPPAHDGCGENAEISYYVLSCDLSFGSPAVTSIDLSYTDTSYIATGLESGSTYTFTLTPWTGSYLCGAQAGADVSSNPFPMFIIPSGPVTHLEAVPGDTSYNTNFAYSLNGYIEWRNPEDTGNLTPAYFIINIPNTDVSNEQVSPYVDDPEHVYSYMVPQDAYVDLSQNTEYTATVWLVTEDDMSGNVTDGSTNIVVFNTNIIVAEPVIAYGDVSLNTLIADISWNWTDASNGNLAPDYFVVSWTDNSLSDGSFNVPYVPGQSSTYTVSIPDTGHLLENTTYDVSVYLVTVDEKGEEFHNIVDLPNVTLDTKRDGANAPIVSAVGGYEYVAVSWSQPTEIPDYSDLSLSFYTLTVTTDSAFVATYTIPYTAGQIYYDVSGLSNETLYTFTVSLTVSTTAGNIPGADGATEAMPTGTPVFVGVPPVPVISAGTITANVWSNSTNGGMGDNAIVVMKFSSLNGLSSVSSVATFGPISGNGSSDFPTTWTGIADYPGTTGTIYQINGSGSPTESGSATIYKNATPDPFPSNIAPGSIKYTISITPTPPTDYVLVEALISVSNTAGMTNSPSADF